MNIQRMIYLIKNDLFVLKDSLLNLYILLVCGFTFLAMQGSPSLSSYTLLLFSGGFLLTSYAFSDLRHAHRGYQYLVLPASSAEKLWVRWFLTSVGYAISFTVMLYSSLFIRHTSLQGFGHSILSYLVIHSVVFLGCVHFKKRPLLKTSLTFMIGVSCLILSVGLVLYFLGVHENPIQILQVLDSGSLFKLFHLLKLAGYIFLWLLAPICLGLAYIRFKNYEI